MRKVVIHTLLVLGCGAPSLTFEERRLDTIPENAKAREFAFSRDGRIAAYILDEGGKDRLIVGGRRGDPLDKL